MTIGNIELYEALKLAKVPEQQARAAAQGFLLPPEIATKSDIRESEARLENKIDNDIKTLEVRMDGKLKDLEIKMLKWMIANSVTVITIIIAIMKLT